MEIFRSGDWSWDGKTLDYVGYPHSFDNPYFIHKCALNDIDWIKHLERKIWLSEEGLRDFIKIKYLIANSELVIESYRIAKEKISRAEADGDTRAATEGMRKFLERQRESAAWIKQF